MTLISVRFEFPVPEETNLGQLGELLLGLGQEIAQSEDLRQLGLPGFDERFGGSSANRNDNSGKIGVMPFIVSAAPWQANSETFAALIRVGMAAFENGQRGTSIIDHRDL